MTNEEKAIEILIDLYKHSAYVTIEETLGRLQKEAGMVFLEEDQTLELGTIFQTASSIPLHHRIVMAAIEQGWRKVKL